MVTYYKGQVGSEDINFGLGTFLRRNSLGEYESFHQVNKGDLGIDWYYYVNDYSNFAAAVDAVNDISTDTILMISDPVTVSEDITIDSTVTIMFVDNGSITVSHTYTVTINGSIVSNTNSEILIGVLTGEFVLPEGINAKLSWFETLLQAVDLIDAQSINLILDKDDSSSAIVPTTMSVTPMIGNVMSGTVKWNCTISGDPQFQWLSTDGAHTTDKTFHKVTPLWWGAVADGTTDDSEAWQAAFDFFPEEGGRLIAPGGKSKITSGVVWPSGDTHTYPINLTGYSTDQSGPTVLSPSIMYLPDSSGTLIDLRNGDGSTRNFIGSITGVHLLGPGAGGTSIGIDAHGMRNSVLRDVTIKNFAKGLSAIGFLYYAVLENIVIQSCGIAFYAVGALFNSTTLDKIRLNGSTGVGFITGGSSSPGSITFQNSWIEGNGSYGLDIDNAKLVVLMNTYFELNTTSDIKVRSNQTGFYNNGLVMIGNHFEGGAANSVVADDVMNVVIVGNNFALAGPLEFETAPHGIIAGNQEPHGEDLITGSDSAVLSIMQNLQPHIGFGNRFPKSARTIQKGTVFFNKNGDKGVWGWQTTASGGGSLTDLNSGNTTANTSSGSNQVTNLSSTTDLWVGITIQIAGETFDGDTCATVRRVASAGVLTLDKDADTGVTGAAITYCTATSQTIYGVALDRSVIEAQRISTDGAGEDDLYSTTIPAAYLTEPGGVSNTGIRILAAGTKTNGNTENKTIKLYFGASSWTFHPASQNADDWRMEAEIFATGATNKQAISIKGYDGASLVFQAFDTMAIDSTAAIILKITGECATGTDEITQNIWHIASM